MCRAAVLIAVLVLLIAVACDPIEEENGDSPDLELDDDTDDDDDDDDADDDSGGDDDDSGGWEYPYYLVIGNAMSESLDLLTIRAAGEMDIERGVRETGAAINQALVHGGELYAVCSLSHSAVVYDLDDLAIEREISLGVGNNPLNLGFYDDDTAYVSNFNTDTVTVYDLAANRTDDRLLATIPMPSADELPVDVPGTDAWARPGGLTVVGDRVYVALSNLSGEFNAAGPGVLAVIDAQANKMDKAVELEGRDPVAVWHDESANRLLIAAAGDWESGGGFAGNGGVDVVDLAAEEPVEWVATGGAPFDIAVCPNRKAYLGNGKEAVVLSFDADTYAGLDSVDILDEDESGLSFASALACDGNNVLYAVDFNHDTLYAIDTEDGNRIVKTLATGDGPDTLTLVH